MTDRKRSRSGRRASRTVLGMYSRSGHGLEDGGGGDSNGRDRDSAARWTSPPRRGADHQRFGGRVRERHARRPPYFGDGARLVVGRDDRGQRPFADVREREAPTRGRADDSDPADPTPAQHGSPPWRNGFRQILTAGH